MSEPKNRFYSLMVVGENHEDLIKKYDSKIEVEPYVKYYYKDTSKLKKKAIKLAQDMINNKDKVGISDVMVDYLQDRIKTLKMISDFDYYTSITSDLMFDEDGNALTTENPDGKYSYCQIGRNLCIPLKLKDGSEVFSAKVKDVDWEKMHMVDEEIYKTAWQLFHGEKKPETEQEKTIYENIKDQKRYFEGFIDMDAYVKYSCSYWNYAYLDEKGWVDANDYKNYQWITDFYKKFVLRLRPEDTITIYECKK